MEWGYSNEDPQQVVGSVSVAGEDKNKSITAVSVSQVTKLTRPNEYLIINKKKIYHINLVAYVYEIVDINPSKIHILVDDHSGGGPLEVNHIIGDAGTPSEDPSLAMFDDSAGNMDSPSEQPRDIQSLQVGDYIRCIGVVKYSQDKANVVAFNMRIIEDPNEITVHILEVIRDSLFIQKGANPADSFGAPKAMQPPISNYKPEADNGGEFGMLNTRDKHVFRFLKNHPKHSDGVSVDEICQALPAFKKTEILESLTALANEGQCWQSDEENTWCV